MSIDCDSDIQVQEDGKRNQAVQLFISSEINYKSFGKAVTDPTLSQYIDIIRPHLERKLNLRIKEAMENYDCESCNPENWDLPSVSEENLKEFIEMAKGLLVNATTTMNNDVICAASECRKQLEDIKKNRNIDNLHNLIQQLCNLTKISNAPDLLKQLCDDSFTYVSSNILSEPTYLEEVPDTYPADLSVLEGILNCVPSESHNSELYKKLLAHSISCVEKLENMFLTNIEDVTKQLPTGVIELYRQIENIEKMVDDIQSSKFHKVEVRDRIENLNETLKNSIKSRVESHKTKRITTEKVKILTTYKDFSISLGWDFNSLFEEVTKLESERGEKVKSFLEKYSEHKLGSSSEPAEIAFTDEVLKQYLSEILPPLENSAELFVKNWKHPSSSVSALVSFKKSWNDFMPVVEGFDAPKEQQEKVKNTISSWVTSADEHFKKHSGDLSDKLRSYNEGLSDISESDCNAVHELIPFLKDILLSGGLDTVSRVEEELDTALLKFKKLNEACVTACQKLPDKTLLESIKAIQNNDKSIKVFYGSRLRDRMSDFAWLPHSNATQQLQETVKGLGDGIDSALLEIKKRWTETNKGGHEYYIDVWNSLTSIRCLVDSNNDTLTRKTSATSAIESYFKELKDTTNQVITRIVNEVSVNHVVVGDEENQKKLISTFAPLGTLLKFYDDAVPSDVQIDIRMKTIIADSKRECLKTLSDKIVEQTTKWVKTFDKCKERESAAKTLALRLLTLQVLGDQISVTESIAGVFSELRQSTESSTTSTLSSLSMVRDYLTDINTDDTLASYVKGLQNDHGSVFQAVLTQDRNNKTKHMTIEKALNLLFEDTKNSPVNKQRLKTMYTIFEVNWKQRVKSGRVDDLKDFVKKMQDYEIKVTNGDVLELCTSLFTLWSIRSTDTAVLEGSGRESAIVTPNVLQVLAVFRMLALDIKTSDPETYLSHEYNIDNLKHHFLEILTGEGKSIVIAIAAAVLAILGNTIHCMCYSDYLCKRDYEGFRRLFEELRIGGKITWDTYENHCERILSGSSSMRMRLACAITKGAAPESVSGDRITSGKTIAIIDEMDTLWNFENYANEYVALETLKLESLTALAELIWKKSRSQKSLFDYQTMIFESDEYKKCVGEISKYNPRWEKLMMSCVRLMLRDVFTYTKESYFVGIDPESKERRICYEDNHGKSYTKRHSYKTMWHAFAAHSEGSISTEERNHYIVLNIIGAKIAYARIVEAYDVVLALTGTLSSMHESEIGLIKETLKDVHKSYMPSAFRDEHKQINVPTVQVTDTGGDANKMEFHGAIIDFILQQTTSEDPKRPICILFDKDSDRRDFQKCSRIDELDSRKFEHNTLNDNSTIGDSQNSEINSQHPGINKIPKMNTLSTMTHPFSRGIDPKTTDVRVPRVNGVLLIQTYLSPTEADEAQARGRVGRQGEPGSWALIFDVNSLRKGNHFNMSEDEIDQLKEAGSTSDDKRRIDEVRKAIKEIRDEHHDKKFLDATTDAQRTTSHHDEGKNFIENLKKLKDLPPGSEQHKAQVEEIQDYILNINRCIVKTNADKNPFRLMLCIDATASMKPVFDAVRETLDQLLRGIGLILEMQGIERGFEINIVGYRNYDKDADHLITISGWKDSSDSDKLKDFLENIHIGSGDSTHFKLRDGEEAIEVALAYANEEFKKDSRSAVMITGDAPPHPKNKVKKMREEIKGEAYWKKERSFMRYCTDFEAEVQKLKSANIPVHTNALHKINALKEPYNDFRKIAKDTGGKYTLLDFNTSEKPGVSEEAFEKLAKDIATNIAKRILEVFLRESDMTEHFNVAMKDKQVGLEQWNHTGEVTSKSTVYKAFIDGIAKQLEDENEKLIKSADVKRMAEMLACRMLQQGHWEGTPSSYFKDDKEIAEFERLVIFLPVYYEMGVVRFHHKTLAEYLIASHIAKYGRHDGAIDKFKDNSETMKELLNIVVRYFPKLMEMVLEKIINTHTENKINISTVILCLENDDCKCLQILLSELSDDAKATNCTQALRRVLKNTADTHKQNSCYRMMPSLIEYVSWEDFKKMEIPSGRCFGKSAWPMIYIVARSGNHNLMEKWIQSSDTVKSNLTMTTSEGSNSLHGSCWCGHNEMTRLLIDNMDDQSKVKTNSSNETPLVNGAQGGLSVEVLRELSKSYTENIERLKELIETWETESSDGDDEHQCNSDRDTEDAGAYHFLSNGYIPKKKEFIKLFTGKEKRIASPSSPLKWADGKLNKVVDQIQEKVNKFKEKLELKSDFEPWMASLIGSDPTDALEMLIATVCYTSPVFYGTSKIKESMYNVARNDEKTDPENKKYVEYLKPFIYHLRKALLRFPPEHRLLWKGDSRFSAKDFEVGEIKSFNHFFSTSRKVEGTNAFMRKERCSLLVVLGFAANIAPLSVKEKEEESLFSYDATFRVLWVYNPSTLRIFGCSCDIIFLQSTERINDFVKARSEQLKQMREVWCTLATYVFAKFERCYVDPTLCKLVPTLCKCVTSREGIEDISLTKLIKDLLESDDRPPLVLQSEAGGGKTSAGVKLIRELNEKYFPVFVSMGSVGNAFEPHAIDKYIVENMLPPDCDIKQLFTYTVVIVLDSFDEGTANVVGDSGTDLLKLNPLLLSESWVILTSRTENFIRRGLTPKDLLGDDANSYYLRPFSTKQRDDFGEKMIKINKDVQKNIEKLKQRRVWCELSSPQLLYMATTTHHEGVTSKSTVYKAFIDGFIKKQLEDEKKENLIKSADVKRMAEMLACRMLQQGHWGGKASNYFKDDKEIAEFERLVIFLPVYYEMGVVRFHHKTLAEYLIASHIAKCGEDELREMLSKLRFSKTQPGILEQHKLIQQSTGNHDELSKKLLPLVKTSEVEREVKKEVEKKRTIASNALSLLVSSGCTLFGEDLSGLRLEDVSFCGGCLVEVNFEGSFLINCDFKRCLMMRCNFKYAEIDNPTFDIRLPPISVDAKVKSIFTSSSEYVVAAFNNHVGLYSSATGKVVKKINLSEYHPLFISGIACNSAKDDKNILLATCSDAGTNHSARVVIWSPFQEGKYNCLKHEEGDILLNDLVFSPDDAHLAVALKYGGKPSVMVWDVVKNGDQEEPLWRNHEGVNGAAKSIAYTPAGDLVCVQGKEIVIWRRMEKSYELLQSIASHTQQIAVLPMGVNNAKIDFAWKDGENMIHIWSKVNEKYEQRMKLPGNVGGLALSTCGNYVALGGLKEVEIISLLKKQPDRKLHGHGCKVMSIRYSSNGEYITTSGYSDDDHTVRLWNTREDGYSPVHHQGHKQNVTHVSIYSDLVASGCESGLVIIWNLQNGTEHVRLRASSNSKDNYVVSLSLSKLYLVTMTRSEIKVFVKTHWNVVATRNEINISYSCMAVRRDGKSLSIFVGAEHKLEVFNETLQPTSRSLAKEIVDIEIVDIACTTENVACATPENVLLLSPDTLKSKLTISQQVKNVTFSDCGKFLVGVFNGEFFQWEAATGVAIGCSLSSYLSILPSSLRNGDFVVCNEKMITLQSSKGIVKHTLEGHSKKVQAVIVSSDGNVIITASDNLRVWRERDGRWELQYYLGDTPPTSCRMFESN